MRQLGSILMPLMSSAVAVNADELSYKSTEGFALLKVKVVLAIGVSLIVIDSGAGHPTSKLIVFAALLIEVPPST